MHTLNMVVQVTFGLRDRRKNALGTFLPAENIPGLVSTL